MEKQLTKHENATATITFDFDKNEIEKKRRPIFRSYQKRLNLNGFRKGKVPYKMAERLLGKGFLDEAILEQLVKDNFDQAAKDLSLRVTSTPQVSEYQFNPDGSFNMVIEFATNPEITINNMENILKDSEGLEVLDDSDEKLNELVEEKKEALLVELATKEPTNQPAQNGDYLELSIIGPTVVKNYPDEYNLVLGSDDFYLTPDIQEKLVGSNIGDIVDIEEGNDKFKIKIDNILKVNKPEYNEEFVKENFFVDSVKEFEDFLKNQVKTEYMNRIAYLNGIKQFDKIYNNTDIVFSPLYLKELENGINPDLIRVLNTVDQDFAQAEDKIQAYLDYQKRNEINSYFVNMGLFNSSEQEQIEDLRLNQTSTRSLDQLLNEKDRKEFENFILSSEMLRNIVIKGLGFLNYALIKESQEQESAQAD